VAPASPLEGGQQLLLVQQDAEGIEKAFTAQEKWRVIAVSEAKRNPSKPSAAT